MKTTSIQRGSGAARTLAGTVAAMCVSAALALHAAPIGQFGVSISGEKLANGKEIHVDSAAKRIAASSAYTYKLSGTCRGEAGTLMAKLVPAGTSLNQFIDSLEPGASGLLNGSSANPGGNLPFTVATQRISGRRPVSGVPGLVSIKVAMDIVVRIDADGKCFMDVTNVVVKAKPRQKLGTLNFTKGKLLLSAAPVILFRRGNTAVDEDSGNAVVKVWRDVNYHGAVSVDYATADGTADSGDYTAKSGTIQFADGESSKDITVPIIDNATNDGSRFFTIQLSNPGGGAVLGPASALTTRFTIKDDE